MDEFSNVVFPPDATVPEAETPPQPPPAPVAPPVGGRAATDLLEEINAKLDALLEAADQNPADVVRSINANRKAD